MEKADQERTRLQRQVEKLTSTLTQMKNAQSIALPEGAAEDPHEDEAGNLKERSSQGEPSDDSNEIITLQPQLKVPTLRMTILWTKRIVLE